MTRSNSPNSSSAAGKYTHARQRSIPKTKLNFANIKGVLMRYTDIEKLSRTFFVVVKDFSLLCEHGYQFETDSFLLTVQNYLDIWNVQDGSEHSRFHETEYCACMSISECLCACVIYAYHFFPKIVKRFQLPPSLSRCGMAAAAEGTENCSRSSGSPAARTGDGEAEEFTCWAYCSELSRRQNEQRKSGLFCDVTLVFSTGGVPGEWVQTVPAHRSVLSAASQYFTLLLGGQFSESESGRVELKEWSSTTGPDPETVESVIQFMYTGEIRVTTADVHEVLELADRYVFLYCFYI